MHNPMNPNANKASEEGQKRRQKERKSEWVEENSWKDGGRDERRR